LSLTISTFKTGNCICYTNWSSCCWKGRKRRRYQSQGQIQKSSARNISSQLNTLLKATSIHIFLAPIMKPFYSLS